MGGSGGSYPESTGRRTGNGSDSGGGPGGEDGGAKGDDCDLQIQAKLFGVVPKATQSVRVDDVLDVVLDTTGSTPTVNVVTRDATPSPVGTLVGLPDLGVLIRCLQDGVVYEATVNQVSGSQISVTITRT